MSNADVAPTLIDLILLSYVYSMTSDEHRSSPASLSSHEGWVHSCQQARDAWSDEHLS